MIPKVRFIVVCRSEESLTNQQTGWR